VVHFQQNVFHREEPVVDLKQKIRSIPDFPKKGILFRDITTLLQDAAGFAQVIDQLAGRYRDRQVDVVAGIESRGFIIGGAVAHQLKKGFVPIRKPGKLPAEKLSVAYCLEYGTDRVEMHADAISPGARVLVVDDLLATGGTMKAACELVEKAGGEVVECAFIIHLADLKGEQLLKKYTVFSLLSYD
jgi:adenine phosphoribosyltransferase